MRHKLIPALALVAVLLSACGSTSPSATRQVARKPVGSTGFPVVVKASDGAVKIPARPTRILSLSASATEMLYAIGAGAQVVGVDKFSTYPPGAPRTSFTGNESSAEGYLPEHPDLVLLLNDTNNLVGQLNDLHIPVIVLPAATTIAQADRQIDELGTATGHEADARHEVSAVKTYLDRVVQSVGGRGHGATYYVELDQTYYSATSQTFIGALFNRFGMVDIADPAGHGSAYPQLSAEYVLKANPDYVFLADTVCCGQSSTSFAARPGFSDLKAVHLGHVIGVNDSVASEWGPHSLEAMVEVIAQALAARHPTASGGA